MIGYGVSGGIIQKGIEQCGGYGNSQRVFSSVKERADIHVGGGLIRRNFPVVHHKAEAVADFTELQHIAGIIFPGFFQDKGGFVNPCAGSIFLARKLLPGNQGIEMVIGENSFYAF